MQPHKAELAHEAHVQALLGLSIYIISQIVA
ncbi:MAG: hypothetical protein K0R57_1979 [Paenibacillaceae bacterium]|jgi:hypothetical protein|nr:hypothetical protein [Paenibacillaceae bacterium]